MLRVFCSQVVRQTNEEPGSARISAVREGVPWQEDHRQRDDLRSDVCHDQQEWLVDEHVEEIGGRIPQDGKLSLSRVSDHDRRSVTKHISRWALVIRWGWRGDDVGVSRHERYLRAEGLNSSRENDLKLKVNTPCLLRVRLKRTKSTLLFWSANRIVVNLTIRDLY